MLEYTDVLRVIPPGKIGKAEIAHDSPSQFERLHGLLHGMPLYRDTYVRLLVNGSTVMTDAEFERRSNKPLLQNASGNALIAGLGIGLVLSPLQTLCDSVTVVELNPDVITLVAPHFPWCNITQGDIKTWKPPSGTKYDTIYFDIWPQISADERKESGILKRKFKPYLADDGWMESWVTIASNMLPRSR